MKKTYTLIFSALLLSVSVPAMATPSDGHSDAAETIRESDTILSHGYGTDHKDITYPARRISRSDGSSYTARFFARDEKLSHSPEYMKAIDRAAYDNYLTGNEDHASYYTKFYRDSDNKR